jgi:hypothetical protein
MRLTKSVLMLAAFSIGLAQAQNTVRVQDREPDCSLYFTLSAASPSSTALDNRNTACTSWTITYQNNGFVALSLAVNQAPDNSGVPGSFGLFSGSSIFGVNPNTSITQASTVLYGFAPWIQVTATVVGSGTITGRIYGFRQTNSSVSVTSSGYVGCASSLPFTLSNSGNTQIVPLVSGEVIQVCHIDLATNPSESVYLTYGTGANCAAGTGSLTGTWPNILTVALDLAGSLIVPSGNALCVNQSVAQAAGGLVTFSQHP